MNTATKGQSLDAASLSLAPCDMTFHLKMCVERAQDRLMERIRSVAIGKCKSSCTHSIPFLLLTRNLIMPLVFFPKKSSFFLKNKLNICSFSTGYFLGN